MLRLLQVWLGLLPFISAHPASLSKRADPYSPPRNVIYIQTFRTTSGSKLSILPLIQEQTNITHVYLAALHINSNPGDINLNDDNPNSTVWDQTWQEAADLQDNGVKVMMMMGGAAPGSYSRLCSGTNGAVVNEDYYIPLRNTLKYHKVDGLDLDIEEKVDYTCPLALLQRLYADFGPEFILTMAPVASELQPTGYGLGGFSYKTLDSEATASDKPNGKLVNWFNAQFYNGWGDSSTPNGYNAIVANGYSPDRVVMGVLDSSNDGGSGWYSLSTYESTIQTLKATYSNFGSIVGWEYWDAGSSDNLANPWQWVQAIGEAVFGPPGTPNGALEPITRGKAPWPTYTNELVDLGAPWLAAIRALNITDGNLEAAKGILNLTQVIGGVLPIKE